MAVLIDSVLHRGVREGVGSKVERPERAELGSLGWGVCFEDGAFWVGEPVEFIAFGAKPEALPDRIDGEPDADKPSAERALVEGDFGDGGVVRRGPDTSGGCPCSEAALWGEPDPEWLGGNDSAVVELGGDVLAEIAFVFSNDRDREWIRNDGIESIRSGADGLGVRDLGECHQA